MFSTDLDFQRDLASHHVYTAWQFIEYTQKNIISFYHSNRFFTITAVSDDDNFIARSSLPF